MTDTPPKSVPRPGIKRTTTGTQAKSTTGPKLSVASIKRRLTEAIRITAAGIMTRQPYDGMIIGENAELIADAYAPLIERNKQIRKAFEYLEGAGTYGAAVMVTVGVAIPILVNHNLIPESALALAKATPVKIPDPSFFSDIRTPDAGPARTAA